MDYIRQIIPNCGITESKAVAKVFFGIHLELWNLHELDLVLQFFFMILF